MVSVSGALAQQESVSIGQNQRQSYKRRMERGEFITCTAPLGYQLVGGKNLEIEETGAETVRWIFDRYLAGFSTKWIAEEMGKQQIPTPIGLDVWHMGCKGSKQALLVLTERRTRMGLVLLVEDHTAASVVKAINGLEQRFGKLFYKLFKNLYS